MKIVLKNFKCHENKTFIFDDQSFILILGNSGQGKSTLLNAILFVLYGSRNKIQTFGKKSSSVEMEYKNIKIFRTKTPNKLIVYYNNSQFEDDIGQNIINNIFGTNFDVVSYIQQTVINSFILKNPIDKLEFLEKVAFKDIDLSLLKDRCKNEISQRKDELNKTLYELDITNKIFNDITEPTEVKFPLKGKKEISKLIKDEEIRYKNCEIRIKKSRIEINKLQKELNDLLVLQTLLDSRNDNIDSLIQKLEELSLEEKNIDYKGDKSLNDLKKRLEKLLSQKELILLKKKFDEDTKKLKDMEEDEIKKYKKDLEKIQKNLWTEYSKEEAESTIQNLKECLSDAKEISKLKKQISKCKITEIELDTNQNLLQTKKQLLNNYNTLIYKCPSCNNKLKIIDNKLSNITDDDLNKDNLKENIDDIKTLIKDLEITIKEEENQLTNKKYNENILNEILLQYEEELDENSLEDDLNNIRKYYNIQINYEGKIKEIENILSEGIFSSSYTIFKKEIDKIFKKIQQLEEKSGKGEEILCEEELRNAISIEQNNKDNLEKILKNKNKMEDEKQKFENQIEDKRKAYLETYEKIRKVDDIKKIIKENENIIKENEKNKEIHSENLKEVEKYNKYIEDKNKYLEYKKKISNLEEKEKEDRKKYISSQILKEKILEAESIAIYNMVETINIHAQNYLEYFFPDNPIIVKLLCFKETKKNDNKPQINIEIDYKGNECDLGSLSGGELQRVVLAFTLALSEIFNSPLLMLDESTSNLDQELTNLVFDVIKEHFKDKLVLIVAHQIVVGLFDKIINI
jgi:DNA repair exonuclease SbcCD ATPase subunit